MNYLKRHKELIPLVIALITLGFASFNLFNEQEANSDLMNSGNIITPESFSGRVACEIPIPDLSSREVPASDIEMDIQKSGSSSVQDGSEVESVKIKNELNN